MKSKLIKLEHQVKSNLQKIGRSDLIFFKFDYGNDGGGDQENYIGMEDDVFKWVFYERGRPYVEGEYDKESELLSLIILKEVEVIAIELCKNEIGVVHGPNKKIFRKQVELLEKINFDWAEKRKIQIKNILRQQPYDESVQLRWDYRNKLQKEGESYTEADSLSYQKYPKPEKEEDPEI